MSANNTVALFREIVKVVAPPPELTVSEWADLYRRLSPESSPEPGQWRTERAPYQRDIMDAIHDSRVETVVVMTSSQVGKTEILLNIIGYHIDFDPAPILLIMPTDKIAEAFSKDRLAPMIRDSPALRGKVADAKSRDSGNTLLHKTFPGGHITLVGANSPSGLAMRPIRILLADEVDRFPASAGTEGDPLALAEKRTTNFWNRKKVFVSTPTLKGLSRIELAYERGTQEKWSIQCPRCGEYHPIVLRDIRFDYDSQEIGHRKVYQVHEVYWRCPSCLEHFGEHEVKKQPGKWIPGNPVGLKNRVRSFWLNAFVSPWSSWRDIVQEFLESKDHPELFKAFTNTVLAETWEDRGDQMEEDSLLSRREEYPADLPDGVLLLTAGVDTQDDRLEYEIVGWGHGDESWGIEYGVIIGKPDDPQTLQQLDDVLSKVFRFKDGKGLKIACACVDSGGHFTSAIYKFTKKNEHRRILSIKGQGGPGIPLIHRYTRNNKEKALLVILGVDDGKSSVYSALRVQEPGPKYCHFPKDERRGYDRYYFQGLLSERLVPRIVKGQTRYVWEKISSHARNEALDTRVYALAAKEILNPNYDALEQRIKGTGQPAEKQEQRPRKRALVKRANLW